MSQPPKPHSIKVPRLYKVAAKILKDQKQGLGSVKTLVYDGPKRHPNVKAIVSLVTQAVNRRRELKKSMEESGLKQNEPGLDRELAEILITELVWGKGDLAGESRPVKTVRQYGEELRRIGNENQGKERQRHPRYVRVNPLKGHPERTIRELEAEEIEVGEEIGYEQYLKLVQDLRPGQFVRDLHVDNLLVFPPGTDFHEHALYLSGAVLLQDKASCFSVQALGAPAGATALDACAAPGMKTTQLAAAVAADGGGGGKVLAVEMDKRRCKILRQIVSDSGAEEITDVLNADFMTVKPEEHGMIEYIVLDPSCSGSGMVQREGDSDSSPERLEKLAWFQSKLLLHALSFPNVKRVVYSTCSVHEEENEQVVEKVLNSEGVSERYKLVKCLPNWERRGSEKYDFGEKVLRVDPDQDFTNGFFVATFQKRKKKRKMESEETTKEKKKRKN